MKWFLFLSVSIAGKLFGMEEVVVQDDAFDTFASITTQLLLGVIFIAPAASIGGLFAMMRYDKALKSYLEEQEASIDAKIDALRDESLQIEYNEKILELESKRASIIKRMEELV